MLSTASTALIAAGGTCKGDGCEEDSPTVGKQRKFSSGDAFYESVIDFPQEHGGHQPPQHVRSPVGNVALGD